MSEACLIYLLGMKDEWVALGAGMGGTGEPGITRPFTVETEAARERVGGGVEMVDAEEEVITEMSNGWWKRCSVCEDKADVGGGGGKEG